MSKKFKETLAPVLESNLSLSEFSMGLHEMYAAAVSNAPEDELENFTAKRLTPVYLSLCQLLENIREK